MVFVARPRDPWDPASSTASQCSHVTRLDSKGSRVARFEDRHGPLPTAATDEASIGRRGPVWRPQPGLVDAALEDGIDMAVPYDAHGVLVLVLLNRIDGPGLHAADPEKGVGA